MGGGTIRPLTGPTLVTGATGFVGMQLCADLGASGLEVRGTVRGMSGTALGTRRVEIEDLSDRAALRRGLSGVENVVHLAARVHVMRDSSDDPTAAFRKVNVEGTRVLLEECAAAGVKRFVYISSVKAVGEENAAAWTESVTPRPVDPYGVSKLEAEQLVRAFAGPVDMRALILRLPLVYGPGVRGNMLRLFQTVDRRLPLPLGGIQNRRSIAYVGNVVYAIRGVLSASTTGSEIFFVSDGEDLSTPDLIRRIARALERDPCLIRVSEDAIRIAGRIGDVAARILPVQPASPAVARLLGSLTVDSSKLTSLVGPMPFTVDQGLSATAAWFRSTGPTL